METLKLMLSQRGVDVSTSEVLESDFPAVVTKIGSVIVFNSNRARISEKDVGTLVGLTREYGGTLGIIIVSIAPSPAILHAVSMQSNVLQIFHTGQLTFDITTHRKVPAHRILKEEEVKNFLEKFRISLDDIAKAMRKDHIQVSSEEPMLVQIAMKHKEYMPIPHVSSQDAAVRWIGGKPGDIVEVMRKSPTAGATPYYRFCVASV